MDNDIEHLYFMHNYAYLTKFQSIYVETEDKYKKKKMILNPNIKPFDLLVEHEFKDQYENEQTENMIISAFDSERDINKKLHIYTNSKLTATKLTFIEKLSKFTELIGVDKIKDKVIPFLKTLSLESLNIKLTFLNHFDDIYESFKGDYEMISIILLDIILEFLVAKQIDNEIKKTHLDLLDQREQLTTNSIESLKKISSFLTNEDLGRKVLTFIITLSHHENPDNKLTAVKILYSLINIFDDHLCQNFVIHELVSLCEETYEIKKLIIDCSVKLTLKIEDNINLFETKFINCMYVPFSIDSNWSLKQHLVYSFEKILINLNICIKSLKVVENSNTNNGISNNISKINIFIQKIVEIYILLSYDKIHIVKLSCIEVFGKLSLLIPQELRQNKKLIDLYYQTLSNYYLNIDIDKSKLSKSQSSNESSINNIQTNYSNHKNFIYFSIFNFPAICLVYYKNYPDVLLKCLNFFLKDKDDSVIYSLLSFMSMLIDIFYFTQSSDYILETHLLPFIEEQIANKNTNVCLFFPEFIKRIRESKIQTKLFNLYLSKFEINIIKSNEIFLSQEVWRKKLNSLKVIGDFYFINNKKAIYSKILPIVIYSILDFKKQENEIRKLAVSYCSKILFYLIANEDVYNIDNGFYTIQNYFLNMKISEDKKDNEDDDNPIRVIINKLNPINTNESISNNFYNQETNIREYKIYDNTVKLLLLVSKCKKYQIKRTFSLLVFTFIKYDRRLSNELILDILIELSKNKVIDIQYSVCNLLLEIFKIKYDFIKDNEYQDIGSFKFNSNYIIEEMLFKNNLRKYISENYKTELIETDFNVIFEDIFLWWRKSSKFNIIYRNLKDSKFKFIRETIKENEILFKEWKDSNSLSLIKKRSLEIIEESSSSYAMTNINTKKDSNKSNSIIIENGSNDSDNVSNDEDNTKLDTVDKQEDTNNILNLKLNETYDSDEHLFLFIEKEFDLLFKNK